MKKKVFITTAIDYTNKVIHIGHAYEKILADCVARYYRAKLGNEAVHYTTGTDEHGTTSQKAAEKRGLDPLEHVTEISIKDKEQIDSLNVSYDRFIRTTDEDHRKFSAEFFQKSFDNGDIYKDKYVGYYCEGCEAHKTLTELDEAGQCRLHPTRKIQKLDEENYFFKWSNYEDFLKEAITSNRLKISPQGRRAEMLAFLDQGLRDITVTRPKYKVSWGITAPIDEEQVIYVWFDALINYLTEGYQKGFWDEDTTIVHFVGKDIARWHTLLWPAMLESAGYKIPDEVYVHGFINFKGQKISKSLGNVIRTTDLVKQFGVDPVRYFLLKYGPITEDSDFSIEQIKDVYNGELANGLGNTVARVAKLAEKSGFEFPTTQNDVDWSNELFDPFSEYRTDKVLQNLWGTIAKLDKHINENEPWSIEDSEKLREVLTYEVSEIRKIAQYVEPFLPETTQKIKNQFEDVKITAGESLFPRLS